MSRASCFTLKSRPAFLSSRFPPHVRHLCLGVCPVLDGSQQSHYCGPNTIVFLLHSIEKSVRVKVNKWNVYIVQFQDDTKWIYNVSEPCHECVWIINITALWPVQTAFCYFRVFNELLCMLDGIHICSLATHISAKMSSVLIFSHMLRLCTVIISHSLPTVSLFVVALRQLDL